MLWCHWQLVCQCLRTTSLCVAPVMWAYPLPGPVGEVARLDVRPLPLQPIIRQQLFERDDVVNIQHDRGLGVCRVELSDKLPAPATRWQYAVGVNGHDRGDLRLPVLDHLGDRAVLGAEPDTAGHVETNARVDVPAGAAQGGPDLPRGEVLAERQGPSHALGGVNELYDLCVGHLVRLRTGQRSACGITIHRMI